MTAPIKLSELEAKARDASDAPWVKVEHGRFQNLLPKYSIDCNRQNSMSGDPVVVCENLKHKDADFITEANPLTISRLCEAIRIAHGAMENTKVTFQSLFLVAQNARIALPDAKIISMPLSDFRSLRELGVAINQCNEAAKRIDESLTKIKELVEL